MELQEKLKLATGESESINAQEKLFGWATTKYSSITKMSSGLEPYVTLWTTVSQFYDKFATWMNGTWIFRGSGTGAKQGSEQALGAD